jgi:hypothetical protein
VTGADPLVGRVIDGRYEIQARIGEGGMGVVYRCRQVSIDRIVAIKMLNPEMATDPSWVQRFNNEARACSRLQHPNTIRMFDFGQTSDGRLFMTMEFLDGMVLRQVIQQGPMAPQRVMKVLIQCCASLAEAHALGIVHRDIKPDNVFMLNMAGSPDFVKLLDFSVAKLLQEGAGSMKTKAGVVFGTPQYMSPEQGRGMPLDARSDLYALGILGFEMLTGQLPFHDENPMTVIQMHLRAELPPMPGSIPYSVQQLIRRATEKDPARRYQSAGEMMQHAQQVFAELGQGGVAIGAAGVPRTVVAAQIPQAPPGGIPAAMPGMGGPPPAMPGPGAGFAQSSAGAKTMIAGLTGPGPMAPGMGGPPPPMGGPPPPMGGPPPPMGGPPPPMGGPLPPGAGLQAASPMQKTIVAGLSPLAPPPSAMRPGQQEAAPPANKTIMLHPSEGVVSVARGGAVLQGASTTFWVVSLLTGMLVGVLAFLAVRVM